MLKKQIFLVFFCSKILIKSKFSKCFKFFFKNEALYYEILEKLKSQGFDSTNNYQDIIIALYQQRSSSLKQLNELLYYMKQLNINCNEPVQGIKVKTKFY